MKLGIMQPYFFPYIGYFQLIQAVDKYIFFDTTQYERGKWMNRNRIINIKEGSTYITVPVENAPLNTPLKDIQPDNKKAWQTLVLSQLDVYRKRSPYFSKVMELVKTVINEEGGLANININSVVLICEYLGISFNHSIYSEMEVNISPDCKGDEWALEITKALGYDTYINAPGGSTFYDVEKFRNSGIEIKFIQPNLTPYNQKIGRFEKGLSIIDVLMFNSINDVREMLKDYTLT